MRKCEKELRLAREAILGYTRADQPVTKTPKNFKSKIRTTSRQQPVLLSTASSRRFRQTSPATRRERRSRQYTQKFKQWITKNALYEEARYEIADKIK